MICIHPVMNDSSEVLLDEGEEWSGFLNVDIVSNVTTRHSADRSADSNEMDAQEDEKKRVTIMEYREDELGALFEVFDTLKRLFLTKDQYARALHYIGIENQVFSPFGPEQKQMNKEQFIKAAKMEINQHLLKAKIRAGMKIGTSGDVTSQSIQQAHLSPSPLNNHVTSTISDCEYRK